MGTPPGPMRIGTAFPEHTDAGRMVADVKRDDWSGYSLRLVGETNRLQPEYIEGQPPVLIDWNDERLQLADSIIKKVKDQAPEVAALEFVLVSDQAGLIEKANDASVRLEGGAALVDESDPKRSVRPRVMYRFQGFESETNGADLEFDDGTYASVHPPRTREHTTDVEPSESTGQRLDAGNLVLEPITEKEFASVELIFEWLDKIAREGGLEEHHEQLIHELSARLREEQIDTKPGVTQRWKLVGALRIVAKVVLKLPLANAYYGMKLIMLINDIGYTGLASELDQFFSG